LRIPGQLVDEIVAHAREEVPNECCGIVGGRDGDATTVYRARNEFASPTRFQIETREDQPRIMHEIEESGEELVGIYHSHTKTPAMPSQTDINLAEWWPDQVWLICSLADPERPDVRGFSIRDGTVEEVELDVE
jgi:[CysO sulfur-carrier protein]-S-L-cysteine hydrolase